MSKKIFTEKEIKLLSTNKYVKSVSEKELLIQMNLRRFLLQKKRKASFQEKYLKSVVLMLRLWG